MLDLPITWDAIVAEMVAFAGIPAVPAIICAVVAISLVVYLGEQLIGLFTSIRGG